MRFKKLVGLLKSRKGMTLLEVIVASAVSSVVLICALGMVVPLMNSVRTNKEMADAKNSSARMINFIQQKVQYKKTLSAVSTTSYSDTGNNTIYQQRKPIDPLDPLKSEVLITYFTQTGDSADGVDVLGEGFYSNLDFIITYKQAVDNSTTPPTPKNAIEVTVEVRRKQQSKVIYKITETIHLLNSGVVDTAGVNPTPATDEFQYLQF